MCYEAVAAVYPSILVRHPHDLPPPKPPRREVVVSLLTQGVEIKVERKEKGDEVEEEEEEEEGKIQIEGIDSMKLSLYNSQ